MTQGVTTHTIPYPEYRAIIELMHAHLEKEHLDLRAIVAFGDLVTAGNTFDIDLLEVIEGWTGMRYMTFSGSQSPLFRGRLRLYILRPDEFENPDTVDADDRAWVLNLLDQVRRGYEIVLEVPSSYAANVLSKPEGVPITAPPASGVIELENPFSLPNSG